MKVLLAVVCLLNGMMQFRESAAAGVPCTTSYSCGTGHCCRDSSKRVISTATGNSLHAGFLVGSHRIGVCSNQKAQMGEMCDSSCLCDVGLACYRPRSGTCCAAAKCVDEAYAKQQALYWANCSANPDCHLPA